MTRRTPTPRTSRETEAPKPLWRIGPAFWILLPIAIALALILLSGIDGRYYVLRTIQWLFGTDAMMWFVTVGLTFHATDFNALSFGVPPEAHFGLVSLCLTLIAMGVHPRRFPIWTYLAIAATALALPPMQAVGGARLSVLLFPGAPYGGWQTMVASAICSGVVALAAGAVLWVLTRSLVILAFLVTTGALAAWLNAEVLGNLYSSGWLLGDSAMLYKSLLDWIWNPALFTLLLWWAIRARRAWKPAWACPACGYDLRNLSTPNCPECGRPQHEAATTT